MLCHSRTIYYSIEHLKNATHLTCDASHIISYLTQLQIHPITTVNNPLDWLGFSTHLDVFQSVNVDLMFFLCLQWHRLLALDLQYHQLKQISSLDVHTRLYMYFHRFGG